MSNVTGFPPPPYGQYPPAGGQYPPGYPMPGMPPQGYGQDAYSQGYQQGANSMAGAAGQVANFGNTLTNTSTTVYGTMSGVIGTTASMLGTVSNTLTSLFGGLGSFGYDQQGHYQQPGYGQPVPGQAYGPEWGPDLAQAHQEAMQVAYTASSASRVKSAIDGYADAAATARKQMQDKTKVADKALQDLQAAVGRLQQAGGPSSPQGQALLAEIQTKRNQAAQAMDQVNQAARAVYANAYKAQVAFWVGQQRHNLGSNSVMQDVARAWSAYNGAPTERLHWYSLSKSPVPNAVTMQQQVASQVGQTLTNLDNMLRQAYQQPTGGNATSSGQFLPR